MRHIEKDPDSIVFYTADAASKLQGRSLSDFVIEVTGGDGQLTLGTGEREPTSDLTSITFWLEGGTDGQMYGLTFRLKDDHVPQMTLDDDTIPVLVRQR